MKKSIDYGLLFSRPNKEKSYKVFWKEVASNIRKWGSVTTLKKNSDLWKFLSHHQMATEKFLRGVDTCMSKKTKKDFFSLT